MKHAFLLLASCILLTSAASAQIGATPQKTAITISPIHLLLPIVEITAEFNVAPRTGIAAIGGIGSVTTTNLATGEGTTFTAIELGASYRYYLIGDFDHGMQLGGEMLYLHVSGDIDEDISGAGRGLGVGPFLGYKIAAGFGLTFEAQAGAQMLLISASAEDSSTGQSGSGTGGVLIPLVNLNLGWSF